MKQAEIEKILSDQRLDFESAPSGVRRRMDFDEHFKSPAVSVIQGIRRCGKSTLLRQMAVAMSQNGFHICYLSLDDPRLASFRAKDFETVYSIWQLNAQFSPDKSVLFFDEVQDVNGWEKWINYFSQNKKHKVFITGSNSSMLSGELGTYMTGRHLDVYLTPLSYSEMLNIGDSQSQGHGLFSSDVLLERKYEEFVKYGGFPRCALDQTLSYLPVYYADIVQKDIIVRGKIRNKPAVESLARVMATETTNLVNHSKVARLLKLKDEATVRKYCRLLVDAYLFYELRCFAKSVRSQTRSHPKYYCVDHAMAKANGFWKLEDPTRILELIVCSELQRRRESLFYWHSEKGYEVDFLTTRGTNPQVAIQVSYSIDDLLTEERETRALAAAHNELGVSELWIVTRHDKREIKRDGYVIKVIPIVEFLRSN
jgi:uncharacterized protein